jgi:hypothetical protein
MARKIGKRFEKVKFTIKGPKRPVPKANKGAATKGK